MAPAKTTPTKLELKVDDAVVYPGRGVGRLMAIEEQEVAGFKLEVYAISFSKENAVLKIPTARAAKQGLRRVSGEGTIKAVLEIMSGRAKKSRQMWSRRSVELDTKVNSGDPLLMAEVVRDLYRAEGESEASFSERGIFENAIGLIAEEVAVARGITESEALSLFHGILAKAPRAGAKTGRSEGDDEEETKVA